MGCNQQFSITKGTDHLWHLQLMDDLGQPVVYTDADTLSARVWLGQDQAVIFEPVVAWLDSSAGTYSLSILASQTTSLDSGTYSLDVRVTTTDTRTIDAFDGYLELMEGPGNAQPLSVYASLKDALEYAPWLQTARTEEDLGDFSNHFHAARTWLEEILQDKFQAQSRRYAAAWNGSCNGYWNGYWHTCTPGRSQYLQDLLDADKLVVTPKIREITAKRAIGTICRSMLSPTKGESNYQELARAFLGEAEQLIGGLVAMVDTNNDGLGDLPIYSNRCSIR